MRKVSSYKCPECGMSYKTLSGWGEHMRRLHPETIPKGWSDARFFYYTLTGKSEGSCIQCHRPTEWNEATGKYSRYCNDPKCKQEYCKVAKQRMIDKYGKPHLLDDPEKQREMLKSKKISGEYKFSDGGKLPYVGSYERDFLMTCDVVLGLSSKDIIAPSPHNYVYMYEDKPHFYIPDFYIPDFNLEIEVKDGGDNPNKHHKIQEVDKVKEKLKDQVMIGNPAVNYFKVVDKKYDDFFDFILKCKNAIDDDKLQQVQAKITSNRTPAVEAIKLPPLFEARKNAMIEADRFAAEFDSVAGPMFKREIEIAFAKYRDYNSLTHQYSYPYTYTRRAGKFIDSTYKNNENIIIEIPLMVVNTQTPHRFDNDASFDDKRIIDILSNFERNIMSTIKLRNVYKRFPNVSAPYVQWDGYDWMLKVTFNYSVEPANESVDCDEDIANESAFINHKDEYFNLDEWRREVGHNILYIAGLSGSGKSTLGQDLSKKYNATYIELDRIASDWWYEDEKFNPNGYQGNVTALLKEIFKDEDPREEFKTALDRSIMRKRRYSKLYEYCLKHPDQLFIFEGVQIAGYFDIDFLVDKPVIIKNTSRNTSFKRMSIRDREVWNNHENYLNMKANYKADDHNLDSLRKLMRSKASKSKSLPATESANSLDWIIERRMTTNDFKEIPDKSLLHLTRDAYLARIEKNPASMRNLEYYGFYNRKLNELTGILSIASDGRSKCIDLIVVDDIYRNHGIGTYMLNSAVVNHGATWLIVKTTNGPAISIYEKYGFKIVDTYPGKTGMVHRMEYASAATEAAPADSMMDKVLEFNKRMNKFKYGLAINGVIDTSRNTSGSDYDKLYHFANPAQFEKQDGGICWDFVTYEADYFKKNIPEIKFTCWYVIFNAAPNYPTHTFLTFKLGSKYILFESSFRKIKGVWEASSEKDLINFELDSMIHHGSDKGLDKAESHVFKYNALDTSLNGMTCGEFMHHIEEVGKYVNHTRSTSYNVEKYTPDEAANESVNKSKIDKDFESKGHKSLSSFKCTKLTHELRKKYEVDSKMLKDACENDETHDARIWLDGDKMVAHVCVFTARKDDPNRDGYNWISSLEVSPEYRGYGLGKQLLDFAVDNMGGTALGVYKDNEIAIKMYKDKGFKILDKKIIHEKYPNYHGNACYFMVLGSPAMESVKYDPPYNADEIKSIYGIDVYNSLINDPAHKWRMETGIELIHKEPSLKELKRIKKNWDAMTDYQKKISDKKSIELFGVTNEVNYKNLLSMYPANESAGSDASYYGLPEDKKYPMDDPKHVLLAIKFFNYVDEDKERLLASRINERIKEFGIHNINVGEKNRFAKYYEPVEEEVLVDWAPNVPYMTVANEGADPSVKLLEDGFAYAPIMLDRDLYEKYNGTDYYPLYIILMKNISPLGSAIRGFTREEYSHAAISFDASMEDVYTFGNSVIKKPFGRQKSFGAAHESFRKNSFKFSYSEKTEYSLYVMFFKKDEIDRIKKKVDEIFLHHDEYKYNVEGLISYVFNKPKTDPKKLFCSQFVALVINSGRNGILNKDPSMYTPVGLTTIRGVCHIETGRICDYDQYRVEKKTHRVFDSLIENKAYEALEHANIMYNA